MKIALSGAHGTGKTTLVKSLHDALKEKYRVEVCREVPRVITDSVNDKEFFRRGNNTEMRQSTIFLYQVMEDFFVGRKADIVLADRTMIDHLAYTEVLFPSFSKTVEFATISNAVGLWLATYDHIVKVPIEFQVEDDGTREGDMEFQKEIDDKIDSLYSKFNITPSIVTGCVSNRTSQVVNLISI